MLDPILAAAKARPDTEVDNLTALVLGGQGVRALAMWQCGANFTHIVATERAPGHVLFTGGVYARLRHPAYVGWFYWSVGTQLLLCNPLCAALYAWAARRFFAERVPAEELALLDFFGDAYVAYAERSVVGIPGVPSPAAEVARARRAGGGSGGSGGSGGGGGGVR